MTEKAVALAGELLESGPGRLEELRIHEFADDESAHDDELLERLYSEFSSELARIAAALSAKYGKPSREGTEGDEAIPLNGAFRFAVWTVENKELFIAAAHEDRGVPVLLMMGTN